MWWNYFFNHCHLDLVPLLQARNNRRVFLSFWGVFFKKLIWTQPKNIVSWISVFALLLQKPPEAKHLNRLFIVKIPGTSVVGRVDNLAVEGVAW